MTRYEAVALIERMKTIRPTCEKCEWMPFFGHKSTRMLPPGFETATDHAGYVKRCDACASGRKFPWADQLDPDRVVAYASTQLEPFLVAELEQTL